MKSTSSLIRLASRFSWFESVESTCSNCLSFESVRLLESTCIRFSISAMCRLFVVAHPCSCARHWILDLYPSSFASRSVPFESVSSLSVAPLIPCVFEIADFASLASLFRSVFYLPSAPHSAFFYSVSCHSPIFVLSAPKR